MVLTYGRMCVNMSDINQNVVFMVELEVEELHQLILELHNLCLVQLSIRIRNIVIKTRYYPIQTFTVLRKTKVNFSTR